MVDGHTDRAIATTLRAPIDTSETRVAGLVGKAGVSTRAHLIVAFWTRAT